MMKAWNVKGLQSVALSALIAGSLTVCFLFRPPKVFAAPTCYQGSQCWNAQYPNDYGQCGGPEDGGSCGCEYSDGTYVDQSTCQLPGSGG